MWSGIKKTKQNTSRQAGNTMQRQTDRQRQQDKKPHHLLLYLLDLISGVHNNRQKHKKGYKKSKKTKKQWVTVQHKNTTVDEAGTANGGGRLLDCWHLCTCPLITPSLFYNTVSNYCCSDLPQPLTWFTQKSSQYSTCFFSMALHALLAINVATWKNPPLPSTIIWMHVERICVQRQAVTKKTFHPIQRKKKSQKQSCRGHTDTSM